MVDGTPCEVVEIIDRTGMAGEASQVKVRVLAPQRKTKISKNKKENKERLIPAFS